jgi:uncharacterized protein with PIN domain
MISTLSPPSFNMSPSSRSSSTSSASSTDSDAFAPRYGDSPSVSVEVIRCMRCARAVEATSTDDVATTGMVRIATGLYYCGSCANLVGYQT